MVLMSGSLFVVVEQGIGGGHGFALVICRKDGERNPALPAGAPIQDHFGGADCVQNQDSSPTPATTRAVSSNGIPGS